MRRALIAGAFVFTSFAAAQPAAAQMPSWTDMVYVNVSFGQQWMAQSIATSGTFTLYDEQGSWDSAFDVDDSIVFDVSAGYRVWKNLAIGASFTRTSDSHASSVTARVPDLLEFDRLHISTASSGALDRSEQAIHISALWNVPITDRFEVAVMGGPSFFTVTQPYVSGITVPQNGTTIGSVTTDSFEESKTGFHVGADGYARVIRNAGVGVLVRYSKVTFESTPFGTLEAGGFQALAGARIRF